MSEAQALAEKVSIYTEIERKMRDIGIENSTRFSQFIPVQFAPTIGGRIKLIRLLNFDGSLTQKEIAKRAGVDQSVISRIEKGDVKALDHLEAIAGALSVDVTWLVTGIGKEVDSGLDIVMQQIYQLAHILKSDKNCLSDIDLTETAKHLNNAIFSLNSALDSKK
ncbi:hypothetical protein VCHA38O209_140032 [Vibrio chagasii]|nr:hypothetical protein VCHA53O468_140033 [Vibrio chagasii]CAH7001522.1 hypothetical protein VCHA55O507_130115 [Vibrio chagasii]CAH7204684.1 hypothetical protein VCHA38O209_140032 [Vibrio chagasii]CAK2650412.1 hypothetical protein VCRA2113O23_160034 [Vibrio crassostreae]